MRHLGYSFGKRIGPGSVGVSCEHRNNDRGGGQVQSNLGNRTGGHDRGGQETDRDRGARQRAGQPGRGGLNSDFGGGGNGGHGLFLLVGGGAQRTAHHVHERRGRFDTERDREPVGAGRAALYRDTSLPDR